MKVLNLVVPLLLISLEIILNVIALGSVINGIILLLVITSPLWLLLFLFWWPMIIVVFMLLRFTSISTYTRNFFMHGVYNLLYKYRGN